MASETKQTAEVRGKCLVYITPGKGKYPPEDSYYPIAGSIVHITKTPTGEIISLVMEKGGNKIPIGSDMFRPSPEEFMSRFMSELGATARGGGRTRRRKTHS